MNPSNEKPSQTPIRAIHSRFLFCGEGAIVTDAAVVIDATGQVLDQGRAQDVLPRNNGATIESFDGLLMPGLINAHTHLELSALRGKVPGSAGFFSWVESLMQQRVHAANDETATHEANITAIDDMVRAGTVAVGDISNSLSLVHATARAGLAGVVFHEVYGYNRQRCLDRLMSLDKERADAVGVWPEGELRYAPAPHTLYTTHPDVVSATIRRGIEHAGRSSIHLAEHRAERQFLEQGEGAVVAFTKRIGAPIESFPVPKQSPVLYAQELGVLRPEVLVVHLTTCTKAELEVIAKSGAQAVLCPRSNLYIELQLPPLFDVLEAGIAPALGTDSLASNTTLDVLAEARSLHERFASVSPELLLTMATANGARALGLDRMGRIQPGFSPGLLGIKLSANETTPAVAAIKSTVSQRRMLSSKTRLLQQSA